MIVYYEFYIYMDLILFFLEITIGNIDILSLFRLYFKDED